MTERPPERIVGDRVVLRRYRLDDAAAVVAAVTESVDQLRPWLAWIAAEPVSVEQRVELLRRWIDDWDRAHDFVIAMVDPNDDTRVIGSTGLHRRGGSDELEIGYWVHSAWTGRGVATEAARLLTSVGLTLDGVNSVFIGHDRANRASGAIPRRLGYRLVEEAAVERTAPGHTGWRWTWQISRAMIAGVSPAPG